MKIFHLIPNLCGGGAERFIVDLCNWQSKNNSIVLVTFYDRSNADIFYKDISDKIVIRSMGKKRGFDYRILIRLYKIILEEKPDVIHTHLRSLNYLIPLRLFLKSIPIIHTIHSDAFFECPNKNVRIVRKVFFKYHKRVIPVTISKESAESFKKAYGNIETELIYNGRKFPQKTNRSEKVITEIESYKKDKETFVFINIGRIVPVKNQLMLVQAFKKLIERDDANAILLIMGGRDNKESFEIYDELMRESEANPFIHIIEEKTNATDYLYGADYFCLSSLYEGMPITLIEAFATGTLPVCTPVGGIREMVNLLDETLLADSVKEEDYYKALKRAYEMPVNTKKLLREKAVQIYSSNFSIELCTKKYLDLYRRLLGSV